MFKQSKLSLRHAPPNIGSGATRQGFAPGDLRRQLDKFASDFSIAGGANKITLLFRAVVIASLQRAAAIGGDDRIGNFGFGETMIMPAKNGLQVQRLESFQQHISIHGPIFDARTQWKMREDDRRALFVELTNVFVHPCEGVRLDGRTLVFQAFAGIESDKLPPAVDERITQALR